MSSLVLKCCKISFLIRKALVFAYPINVLRWQVLTLGALHQADSAALWAAASAWHDELSLLPKPLVVVNIGGPTRKFLLCFPYEI